MACCPICANAMRVYVDRDAALCDEHGLIADWEDMELRGLPVELRAGKLKELRSAYYVKAMSEARF